MPGWAALGTVLVRESRGGVKNVKAVESATGGRRGHGSLVESRRLGDGQTARGMVGDVLGATGGIDREWCQSLSVAYGSKFPTWILSSASTLVFIGSFILSWTSTNSQFLHNVINGLFYSHIISPMT